MKRRKVHRIQCDKSLPRLEGSFTLEATLVLPIFLFAILTVLYLFQFLLIQHEVQSCLDETARHYVKNAYLYCNVLEDHLSSEEEKEKEKNLGGQLDLSKVIESSVYQVSFLQNLDKDLIDQSIVVGGSSGIRIIQQRDYYKEDVVDLCATYQCRIPVLFFCLPNLLCLQRVHLKNWTGREGISRVQETGKEEDLSDDIIVYVTETGTRYHLYRACTYLKLSIQRCSYRSIDQRRNANGGKYSACHSCVKKQKLDEDTIVYITKEGDRYHLEQECSGLKRTVKEVKLSEIEDSMKECSRCAQMAKSGAY